MLRTTSLLVLSFTLALGLSPVTLRAQDDLSRYVTPTDVAVRELEATEAFEELTPKEKLYAHWMAKASWIGSLITWEQLSPESPDLLRLFQAVFGVDRVELLRQASRRGVTSEEMERFEQYAARCYANCGNYLSFGDTKFVPSIPAEKVDRIVEAAAEVSGDAELEALWQSVREPMYALDPEVRALGLGDAGVSRYYSDGIDREEIDLVSAFMKERGLEAWNTRLFEDEDGTLRLRIASVLEQPVFVHTFQGRKIAVERGDFADVLAGVVACLEQALRYVADENQRRMVLAYIAHFNGGDIDDHKTSQIWWVKDQGPVVETNIGFIETYRDPIGVRAEWEGFVSIVNKEQTRKFGVLVESAPKLIPLLPWPAGFEKDEFRRPDFTSLEVLAFASSGIPAGINIPNYDDIRQNVGFKNVSLGNVLRSGGDSKERITFLRDADQDLYRELSEEAFEVQVGLHELLGHGSGKLLERRADGTFNFDPELVNPLTGEKVASFYEPGETWGSVFSTIASSFEECRAEAVGLHLSLNEDVLRIFGHEGEKAADVAYVNWLNMARAGLMGLSFYDPETQKWGQAHMQGRFALLRVMLEAGDGLLTLAKNDAGAWTLTLDRDKIHTVGREAIAEFLRKLNVYKATADAEAGRELYERYTTVEPELLALRDDVIARAKPRHIWVQPVTDLDLEGNAILRTYPATPRGVIESFLDRFDFMR